MVSRQHRGTPLRWVRAGRRRAAQGKGMGSTSRAAAGGLPSTEAGHSTAALVVTAVGDGVVTAERRRAARRLRHQTPWLSSAAARERAAARQLAPTSPGAVFPEQHPCCPPRRRRCQTQTFFLVAGTAGCCSIHRSRASHRRCSRSRRSRFWRRSSTRATSAGFAHSGPPASSIHASKTARLV